MARTFFSSPNHYRDCYMGKTGPWSTSCSNYISLSSVSVKMGPCATEPVLELWPCLCFNGVADEWNKQVKISPVKWFCTPATGFLLSEPQWCRTVTVLSLSLVLGWAKGVDGDYSCQTHSVLHPAVPSLYLRTLKSHRLLEIWDGTPWKGRGAESKIHCSAALCKCSGR